MVSRIALDVKRRCGKRIEGASLPLRFEPMRGDALQWELCARTRALAIVQNDEKRDLRRNPLVMQTRYSA